MYDDELNETSKLRVVPHVQPRNILVANGKGGCGKTTLATNLAAYFANRGRATALMDCDSQGSSTFWLKLRPLTAAAIAGISAFAQPGHNQTRSFHTRLPRGIERVVVDTPAGLSGTALYHRISEADLIIVPILASPIDIHAAANFIRDVQITGCLRESNKRLLVVANRVRTNTLMFRELDRYLQQLGLPRAASISDSQLYTRAAAQGLGIPDLGRSRTETEKDRWVQIGSWIENQFAIQSQGGGSAFSALADQLGQL